MPIYLRITVNGLSKELTTKRQCEPQRWNKYAQRVKGTNEQSKTLNAYLDTVERQVHEARKQLIEGHSPITAETLKNMLTGQGEQPRMLLEIFQEHNNQMARLVDKEYSPATLTRYDTTLEHVRKFMKWKYNISDIDINSISFTFASDFEYYLKSERECNHNTAIKYLGNLRKIVNYCLKSGWLQRDPFFGYKMAKKEVIREYLTETEIQTLRDKKFAIERLSQVRDIFLFSCYTGLAFIDVFQLTPTHIAKGVDGMGRRIWFTICCEFFSTFNKSNRQP